MDAAQDTTEVPDGNLPPPEDAGLDSNVPEDAPTDSPTTITDAPSDSNSDGGGAAASFPTAAIALGAGNCGGAAVTQTLSIKNTGSAPLTVGDSITGAAFSVSPASLTVAPGATGTLTISATVPQASTAGSTLSSALSITTNDPAHATANIPVTVTPTGATLAYAAGSPTSAAFGTKPENQAATLGLTLHNSGNASAAVTFAAPGGMFSLTPGSATIAAGGGAALTAGFTPTNTTAQNATSAFTVAGAVCGTSVSSLAFTGQGGVGDVTGWPTSTLDFGQNACGGSAAAGQSFTLTNSGAVDGHITAVTFGGYTGYATNAAVGAAIPAGGSLVVSVTAPSIPFPSAVPGNYAATVTYTTDIAGDTPHQVNLTEAALGAILAFDTSSTPNFGNFGSVPVGTTATQNFNLDNNGNAPSSVTVSDTTPFSVTTSTFTLTGNGVQADQAGFAPSTFGNVTSTLVVTGTNLCQPVPTPLNLSGTGQAGGISITNTPTPFATACGTTAATQSLTITNNGNEPMTWGGVLNSTNSANGTWYSIAPSGATLAAGASSTVTITPVAMPQFPANPTNTAQFNDTIVITTNIPGDTPHSVQVSETPLGDILALNTGSFTFGPTPINTPETAPFTITNNANTGSPTANVSISTNGPDQANFTIAPSTEQIAAGATSGNVNVTFQAATPGNYTADLAIASSDVLCAPLPTNLTPSAQATEAGPVCNSVGGGPCALVFGNVNCGTTAPSAQLFMTNTGSQSYTVTGLTLGNNTYYTVAMVPASGVVAPGGQAVITVTPKGIPGTVPSVPDSATYSDTLTIATNANVANPNFKAALTMSAAGVIISNTLATTNWAFGTVNYGSTGFFNVAIRNAGNESVSISLSGLNYPSIYGLESNPTVDPSPPDLTTIIGTFVPPSGAGSWADTGTLTVAPEPGAVFCQPLPASWTTPTISLSGSASSNPPVNITPTALPFPAATCGGSEPAAEVITITNTGGTPQSYTATLSSGAFYTISGGGGGTVPGGGTAQISVTPTVNLTAGAGASTGSSPYDDNVVITVLGTSTYVPITMSVNGVTLSFTNPLSDSVCGATDANDTYGCWDFQYYDYNFFDEEQEGYYPVIQNNGNISTTVTAAFTGFSAGYFTTSPQSASVNPGSSQTFNLNVSDQVPFQNTYIEGFETFSSPNSCTAPITATIFGYYEN